MFCRHPKHEEYKLYSLCSRGKRGCNMERGQMLAVACQFVCFLLSLSWQTFYNHFDHNVSWSDTCGRRSTFPETHSGGNKELFRSTDVTWQAAVSVLALFLFFPQPLDLLYEAMHTAYNKVFDCRAQACNLCNKCNKYKITVKCVKWVNVSS